MKLLLIIFIFFTSLESKASLPSWVSSPFDYCGAHELCAVGTGAGKNIAEADAMNSLAKNFSVKIQSKINSTVSSSSDENKIDEVYNNSINESTDEILKGASIKEFFVSEDSVYALASLDKKIAAKLFRSEINTLSTKVENFYLSDKRSSLYRALKLTGIRAALNDKHQFLMGTKVATSIKEKDILRKINTRPVNNINLYIEYNSDKNLIDILKSDIKQSFLLMDYKISTKQRSKFKINVNLLSHQEHLKVEGFVKYRFELSVGSGLNNGKTKGLIKKEIVVNGRNIEHAFSKAIPNFRNFIEDKIQELNIE